MKFFSSGVSGFGGGCEHAASGAEPLASRRSSKGAGYFRRGERTRLRRSLENARYPTDQSRWHTYDGLENIRGIYFYLSTKRVSSWSGSSPSAWSEGVIRSIDRLKSPTVLVDFKFNGKGF